MKTEKNSNTLWKKTSKLAEILFEKNDWNELFSHSNAFEIGLIFLNKDRKLNANGLREEIISNANKS